MRMKLGYLPGGHKLSSRYSINVTPLCWHEIQRGSFRPSALAFSNGCGGKLTALLQIEGYLHWLVITIAAHIKEVFVFIPYIIKVVVLLPSLCVVKYRKSIPVILSIFAIGERVSSIYLVR